MKTTAIAYGVVGLIVGLFVGMYIIPNIIFTQSDKQEDHPSHETSMSMNQMTDSLKNKNGDDFDKEFIDLMIEHHQGAIDMAELAKKQAGHDEIKKLSDDVISAQTKEIKEMKEWQKKWGFAD